MNDSPVVQALTARQQLGIDAAPQGYSPAVQPAALVGNAPMHLMSLPQAVRLFGGMQSAGRTGQWQQPFRPELSGGQGQEPSGASQADLLANQIRMLQASAQAQQQELATGAGRSQGGISNPGAMIAALEARQRALEARRHP